MTNKKIHIDWSCCNDLIKKKINERLDAYLKKDKEIKVYKTDGMCYSDDIALLGIIASAFMEVSNEANAWNKVFGDSK